MFIYVVQQYLDNPIQYLDNPALYLDNDGVRYVDAPLIHTHAHITYTSIQQYCLYSIFQYALSYAYIHTYRNSTYTYICIQYVVMENMCMNI